MTARNGKAEWHGNAESGPGTITVGDGTPPEALRCRHNPDLGVDHGAWP